MQNLNDSGERVYEVDLSTRQEPEETVQAMFESARKQIAAGFSDSLPRVIEGYIELATMADDDDVRRKASDRILDTFLPTNKPAVQLQHGGGTTIQILNAMPVPETRIIDGKQAPLVEIGGTKLSLPAPVKRKINAGAEDQNQKTKRAFLGPQHTGGSTSPAPTESPTLIPKG